MPGVVVRSVYANDGEKVNKEMTKLNQILAIEKGRKTDRTKALTELHRATQKAEAMRGHKRTYQARDENGETFPDDSQPVQLHYRDAIKRAGEIVGSLMDTVATKDYANCSATADVSINGKTFLKDAPVTFLLYLEKELHDMRTLVDKMSVLDPGDEWTEDRASGIRRSVPAHQKKTKKLQRGIVLYDATKDHPAQTQLVVEDVVVGTWETVKLSGEISPREKRAILDRIIQFEEAVKFAREKANGMDVDEKRVGAAIMAHLFGEEA